jgi:UDPglucose--hexose-1-phosphate uridylyltransferase
MSELRWNPLLGEWVATATHRQDRTFLPPADFCPFCPTRPGGTPTEVPESTYDVVVLADRFPTLRPTPQVPDVEGSSIYPVRPARGVCEVVLYTPDHEATLAGEPVEKIYNLVRVWTDRFLSLESLDFVKYVFEFENKGEVVGVTLHHPHGLIYGYPFVPPRVVREIEMSHAHESATGRCLICDIVAEERHDGRRIVAENESFVAFVPFFARWPFEVHIGSLRHVQALPDLEDREQRDLAAMLKMVLVAYDRLFDRSFPYVMSIHQRPTDGQRYDYYHFHIEFYPPIRGEDRLEYMAGSEVGAGMFINDTLPRDAAARLRAGIEPVTRNTPADDGRQ